VETKGLSRALAISRGATETRNEIKKHGCRTTMVMILLATTTLLFPVM